MDESSRKRSDSAWQHAGRDILAGLLLIGLVALLYGQVWRHGFVRFDDYSYILENQVVRQGLTWEGVKWAFTSSYMSNWHPLTWLSHMIDCQLFGVEPGWHHMTSVMIHAANALLLFAALRFMTGAFWPSVVAAAFFALHPLRVESVAWAAERKDVLAGLFWMLTMLAYAWYARRPGLLRYLLVFLSLALGLMAKPVTLPLVLLLLDLWPLARWPRRRVQRLVWEKAPLLVLAAASSLVTVLSQTGSGAAASFERLSVVSRVANVPVAYAAYLWKTVWPAKLAVYYPHPEMVNPGSASSVVVVGGSALFLLAITFLVTRSAMRRPYLAVGWYWYLGTLVPVIGLFQVGTQAMADRYTYLPLIGIYILLAWGVGELAARRPRGRLVLAAGIPVLLAACMTFTWFQVGRWQSSLTLFEHALRVTSDNPVARLNYGVALADLGRLDKAEEEYGRVLEVDPANATARFNLGNLHRERGDSTRAEAEYRLALEEKPGHAKASLNLGLVLLETGRTLEALDAFTRADGARVDYVDAKINLANTLRLLRRGNEAIPLYRQALELEPGSAPARLGLAGALLENGLELKGLDLLHSVLADTPDLAQAHLLMAIHLDRTGRPAEAEAEYREVLRLDPGNDRVRARLSVGP